MKGPARASATVVVVSLLVAFTSVAAAQDAGVAEPVDPGGEETGDAAEELEDADPGGADGVPPVDGQSPPPHPSEEEDETIPLAVEPTPEPAPDEARGAESTEVRVARDEGEVLEVARAAPALRADPCATNLRGRPVGPLQVGDLDGNLGVGHRVCPRQELAIGGDALLVAHTSDFYGNIRANARGRISAPLMDPRVEGFVSWEAFRYQTVISSLAAQYIGLGYFSWGARGQLLRDEGVIIGLGGRMVLPTTTGLDQSSHPLAMDLGMTAAFLPDPGVRFHVWLNLLGSLGVGAGPTDPRGGVRFGGGVDLRAAEWISFVLEAHAGFGYRDAVDVIAGQGGVRLAFSDEVGLEFAASYLLVGPRALDDGALPLAAELMLNWHMP